MKLVIAKKVAKKIVNNVVKSNVAVKATALAVKAHKVAKTSVAKKVSKAPAAFDASNPPERFSVKGIVVNVVAAGLDGVASWVGSKIDNKFLHALLAQGEVISSKKVARIADKAIVMQGATKVLAYPLSGLSGDTYERTHNEPMLGRKVAVRGSLGLLKKTYGDKNVSVMSLEAARKMVARLKGNREAVAALGAA